MPEAPQSGPAAVLEASTDLAGRLLGARYDVRELLSHGERGAVYLAQDRNYGRSVTLRLSAPQATPPGGEDVRTLARRRMGVRHPHLAAVQGEGLTEGGLHYVAMDHVEGRNLNHMLGDPRLRWPEIHTIGVQVAEALVALHGAWVTHGDVHPGNLVWTEDAAQAVNVKLVDLDVTGRDDGVYVPPGFHGERDPSCDVYALVASLYELSTGAAPSPGLAELAGQTAVPGWFAELVRSVLQSTAAVPSARGFLASLRGAGGVGVASVVMRAPDSVPAPMVRAPSVPVPVVRAPSVPMVRAPSVVMHAPSVPVPMVQAPSGPVPMVQAPSVPVPMVQAPSGAVSLADVPSAIVHAPSLPTAAAPTEDELWFAAVAEFDPLQRIEMMAAESARDEAPTSESAELEASESAEREAPTIEKTELEASAEREAIGSAEREAPVIEAPPLFASAEVVAAPVDVDAPKHDDAPIIKISDLEPPPPFAGAGGDEMPVMVTMRSAFAEQRQSAVSGTLVDTPAMVMAMRSGFAELRPSVVSGTLVGTTPLVKGPIAEPEIDVEETHEPAVASASAATPGLSTREYEATAEILLKSQRRARALAIVVMVAVAVALVWRFGLREDVVVSEPAAVVVSAPVVKKPVVPVVPVVKQAAKVEAPKPVPVPVPTPEPAPMITQESATPEPAALEPVVASTPEEPEPTTSPNTGAQAQLSAVEFRQLMLRANRSPAVVKCYLQHTAGVEQKVEAVVRVSTRGRVIKLRIDEGPLGDCLKGVVERMQFPRGEQQAQHQFVFRTPIQD